MRLWYATRSPGLTGAESTGYGRTVHRRSTYPPALAAWFGLPCLLCGCEARTPPAPGDVLSPRATVEALIDARRRQDYEAFDRYILPQRSAGVVETLAAVDQFLEANGELCTWVRVEISESLGRGIDHSKLAESLDIFSPRVEVRSERVAGDTAVIGYTVGGVLPLKRCELIRRDGRWWYDPGAGYDARLPEAFRALAGALRGALAELKARRGAASELARDPAPLTELLTRHLAPAVARLPKQAVSEPP